MKVTVAICTWNRARLLDQTLAEMRKLRIPDGVEWEVLVVNNNCTDDTDAAIARHAPHLPLRRLFEPKQGHSHARNCAAAAAGGDLLLWTDDDVLVGAEWLAEYAKAAREWPEAGFFVGPVDPWYEAEPPRWIRRHLGRLRGVYPVVNNGSEVRPLGRDERFFGASMAFRMAIAKRHSFNTTLGRHADTIIGGDDTDFVERLRAAGVPGVWVGTAALRHFVPAERLNRAFVWRWFEGAGRTQVRHEGIPPCPLLWGAPRWAVRDYWKTRLQAWCYAPFKGERWFSAFRQCAILRGYIDEARLSLRAHPSAPAVPAGEAACGSLSGKGD